MGNLGGIGVALVLNLTDIVTGFASAVKEKNIQSSKMRDGMFKKIGFLVLYFVTWFLDTYGVEAGFSFGVKLVPAIVLYVCTTEIVSIIENVCILNSDLVPDKLQEFFHINKKGDAK